MDLNHMLRPAKSPDKCTLQLLNQPRDKLVSLFEQKTVKGWWPCTCEMNGEKIIAVSQTHMTISYVKQDVRKCQQGINRQDKIEGNSERFSDQN